MSGHDKWSTRTADGFKDHRNEALARIFRDLVVVADRAGS
jgi:hypothetical protein